MAPGVCFYHRHNSHASAIDCSHFTSDFFYFGVVSNHRPGQHTVSIEPRIVAGKAWTKALMNFPSGVPVVWWKITADEKMPLCFRFRTRTRSWYDICNRSNGFDKHFFLDHGAPFSDLISSGMSSLLLCSTTTRRLLLNSWAVVGHRVALTSIFCCKYTWWYCLHTTSNKIHENIPEYMISSI